MKKYPKKYDSSNNPDIALSNYLTHSVMLEEVPLPGFLKFTISIILVIIAAFCIWASVTHVKEVVVASGQVMPGGYIQAVQHIDGGVVKDIAVKEGQLVEEGQLLLKLDNTGAKADLGQLIARQKALYLNKLRLQAFLEEDSSKYMAKLDDEDKAILRSMQESMDGQINILKNQLVQKEQELQMIISAKNSLQQNFAVVREEKQLYSDLYNKGYGSKLDHLNAEKNFNLIQGQLLEAENKEKSAKEAISEINSRIESLKADLRRDAMKNLSDIKSDMEEVQQGILKMSNIMERTTIKSPVKGIVKGFNIHTIGAVIEPGVVIMEIVPVSEDLMVEALVKPQDVGHLKIGQNSQVKVSAYDFSRYGSVTGTLNQISASTFNPKEGESFYRVRIKLDKKYIGDSPEKNTILPGMTVQADIITGNKSIMQYLLKPIYVASAGSFKEH